MACRVTDYNPYCDIVTDFQKEPQLASENLSASPLETGHGIDAVRSCLKQSEGAEEA